MVKVYDGINVLSPIYMPIQLYVLYSIEQNISNYGWPPTQGGEGYFTKLLVTVVIWQIPSFLIHTTLPQAS